MEDTADVGSILGLGISPGGGNGNPLQYSCQENSMNRGPWRVTVHGVTKESDMTEHAHTHTLGSKIPHAAWCSQKKRETNKG